MKSRNYRVKIGIVGCGAIGSGMARYLIKKFSKDSRLTGLYDIDPKKAEKLGKTLKLPKKIYTQSLDNLIKNCDCMVEAINAKDTKTIIKKALQAKKSVLAMSVGKLLNSPDLFKLARKKKSYILLPSGAIAGVDAIKAASLVGIDQITLTTRKPPEGLAGNPNIKLDLTKIKKETVVYDGDVDTAVKKFPQNINVAATIALASQSKKKIKIKIITSPEYKKNSHEIALKGDFGTMITRTDNVVCPDNPKSSYLSVLSGLQTLKQYCTGILIGT